jgi:16S rRNA (guanine527-N7)-methyltransferase
MHIILKYFPELTSKQREQFSRLEFLYNFWNQRINLISRNDIEYLYERHVLHSLGIAKVIKFKTADKILDVGTGGGFPGIPLAILFPQAQFYLIDSVGKKIKVVQAVIDELQLLNVTAEQIRSENLNKQFDFIISRAVTELPEFIKMVKGNLYAHGKIIYLKGGDFNGELKLIKKPYKIYSLSDSFEEDFFETKKAVVIKI